MAKQLKTLFPSVLALTWIKEYHIFLSSPEDMFIDFREKRREREKEKHRCERETLIGYLPHVPRLEIEPVTFGV